MGSYKRILIINTFGIGDVLFSTPLIRAVKMHNPKYSIDFMCNRRCRSLLRYNKNIDNVIIFEKDEFRNTFRRSKKEFIKKFCMFIRKLKERKYDLVIDLSLGYQLALLLKIVGVEKRIGFNYRNRGRFLTEKLNIDGFNEKHAVEYYLDLLSLIDVEEPKDKTLELTLPQDILKWAEDFIRRYNLSDKCIVGIAPGGGKSWGEYAVYRRWHPHNFSYVAEKLYDMKNRAFFLILGSKEENDICEVIESKLQDRCINLCGRLEICQSAAIISRCRLLLCNDGGLLHIAVSQGVRTVSIFGPVDEKVYGPYPPSERNRVLSAGDLECRPCYRSFKHRICTSKDCLNKIDKNKVLEFSLQSL